MRQSLISTAMQCGQKLKYAIDPNIPYGNGVSRAIGTGFHAGLELYYNTRKETGDVHLLYMLDEFQECATEAFKHELEITDDFNWIYQPKTASEDEVILDKFMSIAFINRMLEYYFKEECYWDENYEVLAVEHTFKLDWESGVPNWELGGTMDLNLRDNYGNIYIVDHKTTKKPPRSDKFSAHKTPQASYYINAVRHMLGNPDAEITFVYDVIAVEIDKILKKPVRGNKPPVKPFWRIHEERDKEQVEATMLTAKLVALAVDQGGPFFPNTESFLCSEAYCDHWVRCPFGRTQHKEKV